MGFLLPLVLIMIFNISIVKRLNFIRKKNKSKEKKRSYRKVTKLVLTIIFCYIICWTPYWLEQIYLINTPVNHCKTKLEIVVFVLFSLLSYTASTLNPILYAFLSENFRKSFLKACSCNIINNDFNFMQTENSLFGKNNRSQSEKRFASMITKMNRMDKRGNEMTNISTVLVKPENNNCSNANNEMTNETTCNNRNILHTDL